MSGAFLTSREIFDNPIWKNIVDFRLFFLIYGNAVFVDEGYRVSDDLTLQRGEWLRSTRKLQEDLEYIENRQVKQYSTSVINRAILRLVKVQKLCTRSHQLGTVFTVLNYEQYQRLDAYKKTELGTELGTVGEQPGNNNKYDQEGLITATTDRANEFETLLNEFCDLHGKLDIHVHANDITAMQEMIALGVPLPLIIKVMRQIYESRRTKISAFSYYRNAILEAWETQKAITEGVPIPEGVPISPVALGRSQRKENSHERNQRNRGKVVSGEYDYLSL